MLELLYGHLSVAAASEGLQKLLRDVQQDYVALGENSNLHGMASTLVGVRLHGNVATIFNVGDSRAYLLADAGIHLLTRDHNFLNALLDEGEITPMQAENAASIMHGLTCQFIVDAEFNEFTVNVSTHRLQLGARLLLCSDGLNEALSDAEIREFFAQDAEVDLLTA